MNAQIFAIAALAISLGEASAQLVEVNVALNKPTFGDVAFGAPTSRGSDGTDGTENAGNWTHADYPSSAVPYPGEVNVAPNGYWQVDLGGAFDLARLEIVDRVGCCDPNRLEGSLITLFDIDGDPIGGQVQITGYAGASTAANAVMSFDNAGAGWAGVAAVRIDGVDPGGFPLQYFQFSEFRAFVLEDAPPENAAFRAAVTASGPTAIGQPAYRITDGLLGTQSLPLEPDTLGFTFTVDLGQSFDLEEVVLWNRANGWPERLSEYRVTLHEDVGGAPGPAVWSADIRSDGSNSGAGGADSLIAGLDGAGTFAGQYIVVENLSGDPYNPQIAELWALTFDPIPPPPDPPVPPSNAALRKPVTASGATWNGLPASNLTDGELATVSHPLDEFNTIGFTYTVDLGAVLNLEELIFWNRTDCCPERLSNYRVSLHETLGGPAVWSTDVRTDGTNSGDGGSDRLTADLDLEGTFTGQFVVVENLSDGAYNPQIAELEALTFDDFPPPPPMPSAGFFTAEGVPATHWGGFLPTSAVDGNPNSFTHPLDEVSDGYYLEIDMAMEVFVDSIDLTGRLDGCCADRLTDMTLVLLDSELNETHRQLIAGAVIDTQTIDLSANSPLTRYVRIVNSAGASYGPQVGEIVVVPSLAPPAPLAISALSVNPATGETSLTFNSAPGANYSLFASSSLREGFWEELDDSVQSQGTETTVEFADTEGAGQPTRLYRITRN